MKALMLACLFAAFAIVTNGARAQADYDLTAEPWNGLGYFVTTATEARVELSTPATVALDALSADDIVFVLYPRAPLPVADLLAFVKAGGYLLVADDRGQAKELFAAVGLERLDEGPTRHQTLWQDQKGFERVKPAGKHFLFFNVEEVVTNYPAAFTLSRHTDTDRLARFPVLSFDGGTEHLIVEVTLGRGKLIAIADASLFLNEMLRRFYGNKQLAANLLRYPCLAEPCRATLVPPGHTFEGRFDEDKARMGSWMGDIADLIAMINQTIGDASTALAEPSRATWVAAALFGLCALVAYRIQLGGRRRVRVLREPLGHTPSSPMLDEVRGLLAQAHEGDFAALASPLSHFGVDLARRHRLHDLARRPETPPGPPDPADEALRAALIRVESEAVGLRSREPGVWSAERLLRLHDDVETIKRAVARSHPKHRNQSPLQGDTQT